MRSIIVLAQSAPGILAVNMAIYSGYRLRGIKGAIAASLGAVLPSFIIILAIAMLFAGIKDNPTVAKIFRGIRPVAVGLILVPAVNLARKGCKRWWAWPKHLLELHQYDVFEAEACLILIGQYRRLLFEAVSLLAMICAKEDLLFSRHFFL